MGLGDEIMAAGEARRSGHRVHILDKHGKARWHDIWDGCPHIAKPDQEADGAIVHGSGCRPYIDYMRSTWERWSYIEGGPHSAVLAWVRADKRGAGRVIIEPNIKDKASPNKQWGRWQELVDLLPGVRWAQMGPAGTQWLRGVEQIFTGSFRDAVNVLAAADAAVLPEGGMHHAAAAVRTPVVVLFGAVIHPIHTGYAAHRNLWVDDPDAVGWRDLHPACQRAWQQITPAMVANELARLL